MGNIASYKVPLIDTVRTLAQSYYPDGNVYVAGDSTNEYDFQKSFARDNTVVSISCPFSSCWWCCSRSCPPECRCC